MKKILLLLAIAVLLVVVSPAGAANTDTKLTDTLKLEQGYNLRLVSTDVNSSPRTAVLQLNQGGDEITVTSGEDFSLYDGQAHLIVTAKLDAVFVGATGTLVQIKNLVQYDRNTGEIILTMDRVILLIPSHPPVNEKPVADTFKLKQGYKLQLMSVDDKAVPVQIWLQLTHGSVVYDEVVAIGENFGFYDGSDLVVNGTFTTLFLGATDYMVELEDLTQYDNNGRIILYLDRVILLKPYQTVEV